MNYRLSFETRLQYDNGKAGIGLPVSLHWNGKAVDLEAKLGTGASDCIFERGHGAALGLTIENGQRRRFGTATGWFEAYGHRLLLKVEERELEIIAWFAGESRFNRNGLGRTGFIYRVLIGLNDYEGRLYLGSVEAEAED